MRRVLRVDRQNPHCALILQCGFSRRSANVICFGNKPGFQKKRKSCIKQLKQVFRASIGGQDSLSVLERSYVYVARLIFFYVSDTDIKELEDVFGLNGQVEHKLNFLKKNVSKDIKLVLIAHSIGCYITLEMMKRASELQVLRSVLLFPTIERMAQSPQGKLMTPLLCKLRYVLYMPVYLLSFLPEGVKASLVRFALRGMKSCDESSITTSVNLFSVDCIANILYMASQEMMKVVERDSTTIKQNLKKLIFYYGTGDSWCPQHYYDEIKMDFPDGDIRLCEKGLRHAFVLDASKEMAAMITDWLRDDLTKL
ncbi:lipid droplet-associated hydrolase [Antrostomus carolinensis]|nr:lipid droplet-associated hydrolase [Antrostomus carolinensis]